MKKGFTLIELLTVVALMGLLGAAAVGGYRSMQRGMEQRGVMQNANSAIRAVFQRAQIDRQPTMIVFWNETLTEQTEDDLPVVVGKAVAIRRHGRLSNVMGSKYLVDEFGDLSQAYPSSEDEDENGAASSKTGNDTMYLYPMDNLSQLSELRRSRVKSSVVKLGEMPIYDKIKTIGDGSVDLWAFELDDAGGVTWKPGMAYGFEFLSLQLPRGYVFGNQFSTSTTSPIKSAGTLVFKPGVTSSSGSTSGGVESSASQVEIFYLKSAGTTLAPVSIGKTDSPERSL